VTLSLEKRTAISDSVRFELAGRCFVDPLFSSREEGTACDFLDFVYILEPPPGRGRIRFTRWDHLIDISEKLISERLIVILKARQIGFSWLIAAYAAWLARFHEGAVILMLSKGQDEAKALLGKVRFILVNLPDTWQVKFGADSKSEIEIPEMNSKIVALPATEDAGRSETATVVVQDEADFHEYLDANYAAVKPTIDAGGQLIQGSTSNKRKMISLFKELYRGAPDNGYAKVFLGWDVRPGRDKKWYAQTRAAIPETSEMTPELYMEQEYPTIDNEALAPARSISAFNVDTLDDMASYVQNTVEAKGLINVYQKWRIGRRYMAGTDTSHGTGGDFSVTVVMDAQSGMVVADIISNHLGPEDLAWDSMQLLKMYKDPIWAIEDNEWGIVTIKAAQSERYPRIFHRETSRGNKLVGWHTDGRSRYVLWGELIEAVEARHITIPNQDGLDQFYTVIRNPKKAGRIEAMEGAHDDYPMAIGMAWQMRKFAYGSMAKIVMLPASW
jgi:hypothetical protein